MTRTLAALAVGSLLLAACGGGADPDAPATDRTDTDTGTPAVEQDTPDGPTEDATPDDAPVVEGADPDPGEQEGGGLDAEAPDQEGAGDGNGGDGSGLRRDRAAASSSLTAGGGIEAPPLDRRAFELFSDLDASASDLGAVVEVEGDVLFDFDEDQLRSEAQPVIADLVELAGRTGEVPIEVVGHTDGFGSDDYNLDLSRRRAEAVVAALVGQGVDAARLDASGVGSSEPVVEEVGPDGEDDEAARARNRRVEVTFEGIDLDDPDA